MVNHEKGSVITSCACPPPVSLSPFSTLSSPSMCVCQTALWVVASHVTWANRRRYIPAEHSFALRGFPPLSPSLPSLCFCPFRYWIQLELWAILPFFLLFAAFLGQIITKRMFFLCSDAVSHALFCSHSYVGSVQEHLACRKEPEYLFSDNKGWETLLCVLRKGLNRFCSHHKEAFFCGFIRFLTPQDI